MIRNRLSELLRETNTSQRTLANTIGVRPSTISDIASNKTTRYDMPIVEKIIAYFGINVAEFFYNCDDDETRPKQQK